MEAERPSDEARKSTEAAETTAEDQESSAGTELGGEDAMEVDNGATTNIESGAAEKVEVEGGEHTEEDSEQRDLGE